MNISVTRGVNLLRQRKEADIRNLEVVLALKDEVLLLVVLVGHAVVVEKSVEDFDCCRTRTL